MKKEYKDNYGGVEEDLSLKAIGVFFIICMVCALTPMFLLCL